LLTRSTRRVYFNQELFLLDDEMRLTFAAILVVLTGLGTTAACAQMTTDQTQRAGAFSAAVRALDPHTKESEPIFLSLVKRYVPAAGPIGEFLDFMTASGFECPPITSLAENDRKLPTFTCRFDPDLGPTGEPNLSSVVEEATFYVTADCDKNRYIMTIQGAMMHGFVGP
jgi:hypothetical protein